MTLHQHRILHPHIGVHRNRIYRLTTRQWCHRNSIYKLPAVCWCGMSHGWEDREYSHHNEVARGMVRRANRP